MRVGVNAGECGFIGPCAPVCGVNPAQAVFGADADVLDVTVIGIPHPKWGEPIPHPKWGEPPPAPQVG